MTRTIVLLLAGVAGIGYLSMGVPAFGDEPSTQKAVLITGATSGIGRNAAERLAKAGYFVYAGARNDKDLEELTAIENIQGIRLDVNKQD